MFDLNLSLNGWREQLRQGGRCRAEDIDELESHLREEMAKLERAGLSDEEAFFVSTRRLGGVDALCGEFEKVNASSVWLHRLRWMAVGMLVYLGVVTAASAFGKLLLAGAVMTGLHPYALAIISPLASILFMAILAWLVVKILASRSMPELGGKPWTPAIQCVFIAGVLMWFTLLPACANLGTLFLTRIASPEEYGRYSLATYPGALAISVLLPLVIALWIMIAPRRLSEILTG
jgi:hypothetical protein